MCACGRRPSFGMRRGKPVQCCLVMASAPRPRQSDNDCNRSLRGGKGKPCRLCCAKCEGKGRDGVVDVVRLELRATEKSWCPAEKECRSGVFFSSLPIRQCALAGSEARAPGGASTKLPCSKGRARRATVASTSCPRRGRVQRASRGRTHDTGTGSRITSKSKRSKLCRKLESPNSQTMGQILLRAGVLVPSSKTMTRVRGSSAKRSAVVDALAAAVVRH